MRRNIIFRNIFVKCHLMSYQGIDGETNNVNMSWILLQATGDKDEPNIILCGNSNGRHIMGTHSVKAHTIFE